MMNLKQLTKNYIHIIYNRYIWSVTVLAICSLTMNPAYSAESPQFNLLCSGTETTNHIVQKPFTAEISVDTAEGTWCYARCENGSDKMIEMSSTQFVLEKTDNDRLGVTFFHSVIINRVTGAFMDLFRTDDTVNMSTQLVDREGNCKVMPFSGMPRAKF